MLFPASVIALYSGTLAWATPVLWEGRAPRTYGKTDINESLGPYFRYAVVRSIIPPNDLFWDRSGVKGTQNASHVSALAVSPQPAERPLNIFPCSTSSFSGRTHGATPIWYIHEQPIRIVIDNSSIFTPGNSAPQLGFRRSEIIAQPSQNGKPYSARCGA